jgi:hypothetical protein
VDVVRRHAGLVVEWETARRGGGTPLAGFRKHLAWYLKGYPVGSEVRRAAGLVRDLDDLDGVLDRLDPELPLPEGAEAFRRSHSGSLRRVALPSGWLEDPEEDLRGLRGNEAVVPGG